MTSAPIIQLSGLAKFFPSADGPVYVLKNINLTIAEGDFVAIVGQSGSGKSTLMNILGCLDKPSEGTYQIYGRDVSQLTPDELAELRCRHFGFIFQKYQLISGLTALENVEMPAIYSGLPGQERSERARQLLTQLGLEKRLGHTPNQLSGGQQQRVSIARALMNGGGVIFADEPTGALDSKSGEEVMAILKSLNQEGHTIIMVTHDAKLAREAKRIIEIKDGEMIADHRLHPKGGATFPAPPRETSAFNFSAYYANLKENYKMAIRSIVNNKLRAFLTMLGIIFGIASVISMVAIGKGTTKNLMNQLGEETARSMYIFQGNDYKASNLAAPSKAFHDDDLNYLRAQPYLNNVVPLITSSTILQYGANSVNANIQGCDYDCLKARDLTLTEGHSFTKEQVQNLALVAIIDRPSADDLFHNADPIGQIVTINKMPIKIIGVVNKKSIAGSRRMSQIYMPYTTAASRFVGTKGDYPGFSMSVQKGYTILDAKNNIDQYFYEKHGKNRDFEVMTLDEQLQDFYKATTSMSAFILIIGAIALLVGGIGVMNIMLVSVTERTAEIGIRMAVGAKQQDIKLQFLIESIIVCLVGGLIGLIFSFLLGIGLNPLLAKMPDIIVRFNYSLSSIIIAVLFSTLIGVIFGYFPAKNASRLDPVVALGQE